MLDASVSLSTLPIEETISRPWTLQSMEFIRFFVAVWVLLIVLVPATPFQLMSPVNIVVKILGNLPLIFQSVAVVGFTLSVVVFLFVNHYRTGLEDWKLLLCVLMLTYFVTLCLKMMAARDMYPVVYSLSPLILYMIVGALTACICPQPVSLAIAVATVATIQAGFALVYYCMGINPFFSGTTHRAMGTFDTPNQLYPLLLIAMPLTLVLALLSRSIQIRLLVVIASSIQFSSLMLTWFRGGMLAFLASCAFLVWTLTRSRKLLVLTILAVLALLIATWMVRDNGLSNHVSLSGSDAGHIKLMKQGWKVFMAHPLIGVGSDNLRIVLEQDGSTVTEPKNLYLFYLAEMGIAGALLLIGFALSVIGVMRPLISRYPTMAGVSAGLIALLVVGFFDTPFGPAQRTVGNFCFGLLMGMSIYAPKLEKAPVGGCHNMD